MGKDAMRIMTDELSGPTNQAIRTALTDTQEAFKWAMQQIGRDGGGTQVRRKWDGGGTVWVGGGWTEVVGRKWDGGETFLRSPDEAFLRSSVGAIP